MPLHKNDESRHGAYHDGIDKYFEDSEESLLNRILLHIRGSVRDGTRTQAGLIREDTAGYAFFHTEEETSYGAARDGGRRKSAFYDGAEDFRYAIDMDNDDAQSQKNIQQRHKRHKLFRHFSDPFDTSQEDESHDAHDDDTEYEIQRKDTVLRDDIIVQQRRIDSGRDRIYLGGISRSEYGENTEDSVNDRKPLPFFAQTVFDVIHRAADPVAVSIFLAVMDGESAF